MIRNTLDTLGPMAKNIYQVSPPSYRRRNQQGTGSPALRSVFPEKNRAPFAAKGGGGDVTPAGGDGDTANQGPHPGRHVGPKRFIRLGRNREGLLQLACVEIQSRISVEW